jgi:exosortase
MTTANNNIERSGPLFSHTKVSLFLALGFLLVCVLPFAIAWDSTRALFSLVIYNETFSQIPLIPIVSAFLIYGDRKRVFSDISFGWILGAALLTPGTILLAVARLNLWQSDTTNQAALLVFAAVFIWIGAFALFFGPHAFRTARFPLWFLLFAIPIPEPILSKVIYFLQKGSSDAAELFFRIGGVPYLRQGFIFQLPGVAIRVAEECSGIRSTLALVITAALASYLFLKTPWKRLLLCVIVIPVAILKNGLRIMALSTLAIYVNPAFLYGHLHKHGGIVFFLIGLVPLALLLMWLQKSEVPRPPARTGT